MTAHIPTSNEIETYTGRYVDTVNPQARTICVEDIAHGLANTCRYGGMCGRFYSVAEHAVLVSKRMEATGWGRWPSLVGLHHDDAEAYLGDITRPLKIHPAFAEVYEELSARMDAAICEGILFQSNVNPKDFHLPAVKDADNWALFLEARHLLPSRGINWSGSSLDAWDVAGDLRKEAATDPEYWTGGLSPIIAEGLFLQRHHELTIGG